MNEAEQGVAAGASIQLGAHTSTWVATEREAELQLLMRQSEGALGRRSDNSRKPLGEDLARAGRVVTEELADVEMQVDEQCRPGKIDDAAPVVAVHAFGKLVAGRAGQLAAMASSSTITS